MVDHWSNRPMVDRWSGPQFGLERTGLRTGAAGPRCGQATRGAAGAGRPSHAMVRDPSRPDATQWLVIGKPARPSPWRGTAGSARPGHGIRAGPAQPGGGRAGCERKRGGRTEARQRLTLRRRAAAAAPDGGAARLGACGCNCGPDGAAAEARRGRARGAGTTRAVKPPSVWPVVKLTCGQPDRWSNRPAVDHWLTTN